MSSSLLLQQCPAYLIRLTWIVFVMGGRWPYSLCLVGCCRQDLFNMVFRTFLKTFLTPCTCFNILILYLLFFYHIVLYSLFFFNILYIIFIILFIILYYIILYLLLFY